MGKFVITVPTENEMKITIDEKWYWIPSYMDVLELSKIDKSDCEIYGGWKDKKDLALWYLEELVKMSSDLFEYVDLTGLADRLLDDFPECFMVLSSGAIIQLVEYVN